MTSLLAATTPGQVSEHIGLLLAAMCAGAAICAPGAKLRALAVLAALGFAAVLLLSFVWDSPQLTALRDRPVLLAAAVSLGSVVLLVGGWVFDRYPALLPWAVVGTLPFRVPIEAGGSTSNLLVPLYLVIGAGAIAYAVPRLKPGTVTREEVSPRLLEWLLAASLALYAAQATYSSDPDRALEQLVFFYVPFAVLFALLQRVRWDHRILVGCLTVLVGLALLFAGIGFYEYVTRQIVLNPKVLNANEFASYFRVSSLFFDPNIYGRFLVVVMLALTAVVLWLSRVRAAVGGLVVLAVLWAALVVTFSQSSFVALLGGLVVLGGLRWGWRRAGGVVLVMVLTGVAIVTLGAGALRLEITDGGSVSDSTSGRSDLIAGGFALAANRPITGWGTGAFRREYRAQEKASSGRATAASHTIPITIAAEQGVIGLALYLALLATALARLLRGGPRDEGWTRVARAAVAAGFVAVVVHTMLYAAFLEDPLIWVLLGIGVALARGADDVIANVDDAPSAWFADAQPT